MTGDLRLVPLAFAVWVAAWALTGTRPLAGVGLLVAAAVLGGCVAAARRGGPWVAHLLLVCAGVVAVTGSVQVQADARGALVDLAAQEALSTLAGTVVSAARPAPFGGGSTWELAVDTVSARGSTTPVRGHVRVTAPGTPPRAGSAVEVEARLAPARFGAGTTAEATAAGPVAEHVAPSAVLRTTDRMRTALLDVTDPLGPQARGLVPGMAFGDTTRVPDDLDDAMRVTGLTHATAVSGSHFAIVLAVVTAVLTVAGVPRGWRVVTLAGAAVGFVLLVGPEPSVLRAVWTCAAGLLGLALGRPGQGLPALATASTVLLVVDPWLARSYGFALSCAATAGIVLLAGPLARLLTPWLGRALAFAVAVPCAAQAACGPILVLLDPAVALVAVPANVLAAPALVPGTVLALLATVLAPGLPAVAGPVAWLAGVPTGWLAGVATLGAAVPGSRVPWWPGPGGAAALALVTLAVLAVVVRRAPADTPAGPDAAGSLRRLRVRLVRPGRARSRLAPPGDGAVRGPGAGPPDATVRPVRHPLGGAGVSPRRRRGGGPLVLLTGAAVVLVAVLVVVPRVAAPGPVPPDWQVVACDVGQGDTLVVRSGPDSAVVVDVGPPGDAAARCLARLGVARVDLLVLSHFHTDHVGGLEPVLAAVPVTAAVVSAVAEPAAPARRALDLLGGVGVPVAAGAEGRAGAAGTVAWRVLGAADGVGANDASVALALRTASGIDVVALGDLEEPGQRALAARLRAAGYPADPVEVVKIAHHGSASQDPGLAALLAPAVVLVSVGDNDYGHPTGAALDLYTGTGARVLRTDRCGDAALVVRSARLATACGEGA
ncbi:competence protein ComEC [Isoptericola jiangsuensis]|uniref:Competence protein ComEC n=1 Tax=Isoptericola jiangsuensis TaxID=548579 RepID=A0A2A9EZK8_9MICO|nr:ComEC/Rec2 family competence protein [Isoptericola jiangsuensis]PFG43655.1 competence protein ComEC [Isoptericola jiangsuensis]